MEIRDLQVGDWVNFMGGYFKIKCVLGYGDTVFLEYNPQYWNEKLNNCEGSVVVEDITSIPITEGILESNGFYYSEENTWWRLETTNGELILNDEGNHYSIVVSGCNVVVDYVHDLQHLLHLCGLGEIADKITITNNV